MALCAYSHNNLVNVCYSELLAKAFYAWIQVRNVAAAEKVDMDKASKHYERRLLRRTFFAWHFMNVYNSLYCISIIYNGNIVSTFQLPPSGANMTIVRSPSQQLINAEEV